MTYIPECRTNILCLVTSIFVQQNQTQESLINVPKSWSNNREVNDLRQITLRLLKERWSMYLLTIDCVDFKWLMRSVPF